MSTFQMDSGNYNSLSLNKNNNNNFNKTDINREISKNDEISQLQERIKEITEHQKEHRNSNFKYKNNNHI